MTTYAAFSGGIDSTAMCLLNPDAIPVFTDTGWEFAPLYAHIENFERVTGRMVVRVQATDKDGTPITLPEYIAQSKFMPNHGARFCTRMFKIEPYNRFLESKLPATLIIGLRIDEEKDNRVGNLTDMEGLSIRYPLREAGITRADCIRVCLEHGLLPRYPVYMARGGCKGCYYKRKSEVKAMAQLVPEVMDELQALEEGVQDERGDYFHMFPNTGMSIADVRSQGTLFDLTELYSDALNMDDKGAACGAFCHR